MILLFFCCRGSEGVTTVSEDGSSDAITSYAFSSDYENVIFKSASFSTSFDFSELSLSSNLT